tara:strand:+ start:306 stop:500 length:195 start_codon:yes stop_codon:yes gene_type:complete
LTAFGYLLLKIFEEARVWAIADKISIAVNPINPAYWGPIFVLGIKRKRESGFLSRIRVQPIASN